MAKFRTRLTHATLSLCLGAASGYAAIVLAFGFPPSPANGRDLTIFGVILALPMAMAFVAAPWRLPFGVRLVLHAATVAALLPCIWGAILVSASA